MNVPGPGRRRSTTALVAARIAVALASAFVAATPTAAASDGIALAAPAGPAHGGEFSIVDDRQRVLRFAAPPRRIVSLAPHATEVLFAAGAGPQVVAVDIHSDRPESVRGLAHLNSFPGPDPERLLALRPDLVVIWGAAADAGRLRTLQALGLRVFVSEPRSLDQIGDTLERFARISLDPLTGATNARAYREAVQALRQRYSQRPQMPVFVQAWSRPLVTLSDRDVIGDALHTCGARNVFAQAPVAAPQVSPEAVLARAPRLIVSIDEAAGTDPWERLGVLAPRGTIAFARVDASIQRPADSILGAVRSLCEAVDRGR